MKKLTLLVSAAALSVAAFSQIITPQSKANDVIIKHQYYIIDFNPKFHVANWSAEEITGSNVNSNIAKRGNKFIQDPLCNLTQADNQDYHKSGYDRGHLSPAEDFDFNKTAMDQSFYYTNVAPQNPSMNRGIWADLEDHARELAQQYGSDNVITGTYFQSYTNYKTIGGNQIGVPTDFWKVIIYTTGGKTNYECYMIPNENVSGDYQDYQISLQKFESVTGENIK